MLAAMAAQFPVDVTRIGPVPDKLDLLQRRIRGGERSGRYRDQRRRFGGRS